MASERSIPVLDLSLLKDHREELVSDLKHALLFWGFFYIENYDSVLDNNIIQLVVEQGDLFFNGSDVIKNDASMVNSQSFSGYEKIEVGKGSIQNFHSHYSTSGDGHNPLSQETKYPTKPALLKQSIEQLIDPTQWIVKQLNELILESLSISHESLKPKSTLQPDYADIHLFKASENAGHSNEATHQSFDLFRLIFNPPTLNICDVFGSWVESPSKPNQIAISVGPILEYLTSSVYVSGKFKFSNQIETQSQLHYKSFYNLNGKLQLLEIPEELEIERQQRDKISIRHNSLKITPGSNIGKLLLHEKIVHYKDVSRKWYPDLLQKLENEINKQNAFNAKHNNYITESIEKAKNIFGTFDKTVPHLVRNRTSDVNLSEVLMQMKNLTGFTVTEQDLLKVATIWVDALCFKLNEYDDIIIDSDKAKGEFEYRNFAKRKQTFESKCDAWLSENKHLNDIPLFPKSKLEAPKFQSSTKRLKREILQNSKDRFTRKPKVDAPKVETKGMSLLERIKLKERQALENKRTPEMKYDNFLEGKLKNVLEVVLSLRSNTPYNVENLAETLQNSLTKNPIGEQEAYDCTVYLSKKFPDKFKLVETPDSKILKWDELDREELLSKLN